MILGYIAYVRIMVETSQVELFLPIVSPHNFIQRKVNQKEFNYTETFLKISSRSGTTIPLLPIITSILIMSDKATLTFGDSTYNSKHYNWHRK